MNVSERPTIRTGPRARGFAAVVALLFLATTATTVLNASRGRGDRARMELIGVQEARARYAALAGETLARAALRGGVSPENIVFDLSLPMISVEETVEEDVAVWVIRAESGVAARERRVTP